MGRWPDEGVVRRARRTSHLCLVSDQLPSVVALGPGRAGANQVRGRAVKAAHVSPRRALLARRGASDLAKGGMLVDVVLLDRVGGVHHEVPRSRMSE